MTQLEYADITDEDKLEEAYALIRKVGAAVVKEKTSAMFVCCVFVFSAKQFIFFFCLFVQN